MESTVGNLLFSFLSEVTKEEPYFPKEDKTEVYIINLILFILFLLAEGWCIITTIKVFSVPKALKEYSLLVVFICLHMILIIRIFYYFGMFVLDFKREETEHVDNISVFGKDLFMAIFAFILMEVVHSFDNSKKYLVKVGRILAVIIICHAVLYFIFFSLLLSEVIELPILGSYCILSEVIIGIVYVYACVEAIRFWKTNLSQSKLTGYLGLLFAIMICMIIVILIRMSANTIESEIIQMSKLNFTYFKMIVQITAELIPSSIMCVSLYVMAKEIEESRDKLKEPYTY